MAYFDKLMGKIQMSKLQKEAELWAATCLLVASKFMEIDPNIVRVHELRGKGQMVSPNFFTI